ncbi:hypothetical protein DFH06DRAFT_1320878 [Mycena polygramma]|nr:hypothetical protein DFH06DRAFT_1320878 [Mycena polygramma]
MQLPIFLLLGQAIRSPPWLEPNRINIYQYFSPPPSAISPAATAPTPAAAPAPTPAAAPAATPAATPAQATTPTNPVMSWAPANAVPSTPAHHCAANRCTICDAQYLCVLNQANGLNGPQTGPLPHRRTCEPIYRPADPSIDVQTHSLQAGKSFYVAIPAYDEGIYTDSLAARAVSEGVQNGKHTAVKTWEEAKGLWALGCLRWHGNECRRERLQRADARAIHWAVAGTSIICGSRAAAFRLAQDSGSLDIRIRGHRDPAVLRDWLDNGSSELSSTTLSRRVPAHFLLVVAARTSSPALLRFLHGGRRVRRLSTLLLSALDLALVVAWLLVVAVRAPSTALSRCPQLVVHDAVPSCSCALPSCRGPNVVSGAFAFLTRRSSCSARLSTLLLSALDLALVVAWLLLFDTARPESSFSLAFARAPLFRLRARSALVCLFGTSSSTSAAGPQPAFGSLAHLTNPYNDAPGLVYFMRRDNRAIRRAYKKKIISRSAYLAAREVKAGHSKNFVRRRRAYRKCEKEWCLTWKFSIQTPTRMLIEALIHEDLRQHRAARVRCSCVVCHLEFYRAHGVGGVRGLVDKGIEWMDLLGQVSVVQSIP